MKYLGVDYGKTKIGLAISEGQVASVFKVIPTASLQDSLDKINKIVKDENIERVVIGIPESGEANKITKKFIQSLKPRLSDVEIIEVEETLSSYQARGLMNDLHLSEKDKHKKEDQYAAAIILQNFLDSLQ